MRNMEHLIRCETETKANESGRRERKANRNREREICLYYSMWKMARWCHWQNTWALYLFGWSDRFLFAFTTVPFPWFGIVWMLLPLSDAPKRSLLCDMAHRLIGLVVHWCVLVYIFFHNKFCCFIFLFSASFMVWQRCHYHLIRRLCQKILWCATCRTSRFLYWNYMLEWWLKRFLYGRRHARLAFLMLFKMVRQLPDNIQVAQHCMDLSFRESTKCDNCEIKTNACLRI